MFRHWPHTPHSPNQFAHSCPHAWLRTLHILFHTTSSTHLVHTPRPAHHTAKTSSHNLVHTPRLAYHTAQTSSHTSFTHFAPYTTQPKPVHTTLFTHWPHAYCLTQPWSHSWPRTPLSSHTGPHNIFHTLAPHFTQTTYLSTVNTTLPMRTLANTHTTQPIPDHSPHNLAHAHTGQHTYYTVHTGPHRRINSHTSPFT